MKLKVVYVAGPFTAPNAWEREQNVRAAENMAMEVAKLGAMPLCPHTNTRFFDGTITPEFWYEGTLELLRRCDAMLVIPGWQRSRGVKAEIEEATKIDRPIFYSLNELAVWVAQEEEKNRPEFKLVFIVNGEDIAWADDAAERKLGDLIRIVLKASKNTGRPEKDWELRDADGVLLDRERTPVEYGWRGEVRLFLSLRAGVGG